MTTTAARVAGLLTQDTDPPDEELVRRFAEDREGSAFVALVRRHGPMVFGVCRRVLHDWHLAEDAFQAAFLVLARRATAIAPPGAVAGWLHGVAYRVAKDARRSALRRAGRERPVGELPDAAAPPLNTTGDDVREVIDDEVRKMPAKYRELLVACDLEGRARQPVAESLGIPEGTLSSRLTTARKMLADRLAKRGIAPTVVAGIAAGGSVVEACELPRELATSAARIGSDATGTVPGTVAALADGAIRAMTVNKLKTAGVALAALVLLGTGAVYAAGLFDARPVGQPLPPDEPPVVAAPVPKAAANVWVASRTFRHEAAVNAVAVAGDRVAAGDEAGKLLLWDAKGGGQELLCETAALVGAKKPVPIHAVQFAPDAKGVYFALADGTSINLCTLGADGKKARLHPGTVQIAAVTPQGLTRDGKFWLETVDEFNPDRAQVILGPNLLDKFGDELVGDAVATFEHAGRLSLAAIGGGDVVVTLSEAGELRRWKKGEKKPAWEQKLGAGKWDREIDLALAACPAGKWVAVGDGTGDVRLHAADTGKLLTTLKGHSGVVRAIAFSADGGLIATAGADKTARVWDAASGKELAKLEGHTDAVTAVAFAPDGGSVATGSADKTVRVWAHRRRAEPVPKEPEKVAGATVRKLETTPNQFTVAQRPVPVLTEIKSADDLAKAKEFRDNNARAAVGKQVDFAKEKLVTFVWNGSATDKLNYSGPDDKGNLVFFYKGGRGEDELDTRAFAFAVPKDNAVRLLLDPLAPTKLNVNESQFAEVTDREPVLTEIKSADELAKAKVFRDDAARAAAKRQMDFAREKLIVLVWNGSNTDELRVADLDDEGAWVFGFKRGTGEDELATRGIVYAVPKDMPVKLLREGKDDPAPDASAMRKLDLTDKHFGLSEDAIPKPIEVKSADELAKSAAFTDDAARDAAKKQIDFATEKLVIFRWTGSGSDRLVAGVGRKDGRVAFAFQPGNGQDERGPRARAYAVPKNTAVGLVRVQNDGFPILPSDVRKLDTTRRQFAEAKNKTPVMVEIKSADDLAKAKAFADDAARDAVKKNVDFATEKLLVFVWHGSGSDHADYFGPDDKKARMFVFKKGSGDDVPMTRAVAFAVPKDDAVKLLLTREE